MVAANDVTERERQEERLRENEQRLRQAQRIAGIGWWTIELTSGRVVWSDTLYDIWGWDPGSVPTLESWRASIHAEDRARLNDGDPTDGPDSTREYRIVRPTGPNAMSVKSSPGAATTAIRQCVCSASSRT